MKYQQGYILILTLCITAVMSLLLLSSMQHSLLYFNAANRQENSHQRFYQLEYVARKLMRHADKNHTTHCWYQHNLANLVIQQLVQNKGCKLTIDKTNYQYIVEDLGTHPCLVTLQNHRTQATQHLRLSVLAEASEGYPASLVQLRVIKPSKPIKCVGKKKIVALGISSWRYFSDVGLEFS